jgi:hypothetical protein
MAETGGVGNPSQREIVGRPERWIEEVNRLTEQREFQKKAAGILSEPPEGGMPRSKPKAASTTLS